MSQLPNEKAYSLEIVAIGNAIVDVLTFVDDEFLLRHNIEKSSMNLCSHIEQENLFSEVEDFVCEAGGSAANTINSLAGLGVNSGFMGVIANDHWGLMFEESFRRSGAVSLVEMKDTAESVSGTSLVLITPDSERTMNTHLGTASKISSSTFRDEILLTTPLLYIEGYAFDEPESKQAVLHAIEICHSKNQLGSLTLSDQHCVARHQEDFINLVGKVDILFANEKEILQLWKSTDSQISHDSISSNMDLLAPISVITQSERGCTVISNGDIIEVPAKTPTDLTDLTGAGDQFAAGFLFGAINGWDLTRSARFGVELATNVISQIGPRISPNELQDTLKQFLK